MRLFIMFVCCMLHAVFAAPQFVTFKDGKIGVNFGGYHADAGLGGLLTGDAAHGGLSASAGTPWGPQAAAGLGGRLDGRTSGVAYAGAQANPSVGASAVLAGSAGEHGVAGSEAHAYGKVASNTIARHHQHQQHHLQQEQHDDIPVTSAPPTYHADNGIQKIKPPKKYSLIRNDHPVNADANVVHSKHVVKTFNRVSTNAAAPLPPPQPFPVGGETTVISKPGVVGDILNIPIGILRSLQESLGGIGVEKTVSYPRY